MKKLGLLVIFLLSTVFLSNAQSVGITDARITPAPLPALEDMGAGIACFTLTEDSGTDIPATVAGFATVDIDIDFSYITLTDEDVSAVTGTLLTYFDVSFDANNNNLLFRQKAIIPGDSLLSVCFPVTVIQNSSQAASLNGFIANIYAASISAPGDSDFYTYTLPPSCDLPLLTLGDMTCDADAGTYSVELISNGSTLTASTGGTITGTTLTANLGTDVTVTSSNGTDCEISIDVAGLATCPTDCVLPDLTLGQAVCDGVGSTTYTVSYTEATGATITVIGGTDNGDGTITGTVGTDITVEATNSTDCTITLDVASPDSCDDPCENPSISIGGTTCAVDGSATYDVTFTVTTGATVTSDSGTVDMTAGMVTGVASGTDVTLTISLAGCEDEVITIPSADCPLCDLPILTLGDMTCDADAGTYSVELISNGTLSASAGGTITGTTLTASLGTDVRITSSNGTGCETSIDVAGLATCPTDCVLPDLTLGQAVCDGVGLTTYTVTYTETTGATISISGIGAVDNGDGTITGTIGEDLEVEATNSTDCAVTFDISSPDSCDDPCENPSISIGGTTCASDGSATYDVTFTATAGATVTSDSGTVDMTAGMVTGVATGTDVILTISFPGCEDEVVTVPSADCPLCDLPILSVGNMTCDAAAGTYSVELISNGSTLTASTGGTIVGTTLTADLGTDITVTSSNGADCETSLDVTGLTTCPTDCILPDLTLGQAVCDGMGSTTYTVSYTETTGATITVTGGTDNADGTITGTIGTAITVEATNSTDCTIALDVASPDSCDDPCENPSISIGGTTCASDGGTTYDVSFSVISGATVTSDSGTVDMTAGMVTGIASGTDVTLTVSFVGCEDEVITLLGKACQEPMMELEKEGTYMDTNGDTVVSVGDEIHYTFTITNTGNVDLTDVTVTDPLLVAPNGSITGDPIATLAVGAEDTTTFTGIYVLTQADIDAGEFENSATVTGGAVDENGDPITDENDDPLVVTDTSDDPNNTEDVDENGDGDPDDPTTTDLTNPMMELEKEGTYMDTNGDTVVSVGDEIHYTFTVTNTGNVDLTDVTVTDPLLVAPNGSITGGPIATLAVGADDTTTFTGIYVLTQADIDAGEFENSATVTGGAVDENGDPITDENDDPLVVTDTSDDPNNTEDVDENGDGDPDDPTTTDLTNPMIELEKEGTYMDTNGDTVVSVGDEIHYTFTITNTGNVDLTDVTVTDPLLVAPNGSITGGPIATLAVGADDTTTFTGIYVLTQADIDAGEFENSATVTGGAVDENGDPITDENDDPLVVTDTSDDPNNTEDVDENGDGDPDDPTTTDLTNPMIELEKEGTYMDTNGDTVVSVGDEIHYTFTITNTGNVDLTDVTVTDPLLVAPNGSITGDPIATLAVGAEDTTTFTGVYVLTQADIDAGEFENSATVTGGAVDENGDPITDENDDPLVVTDTSDDPNNTEDVDENGDGDPDDPTTTDLTNPMMELEKEGTYMDTNGDTVVSVGDEIHYTFTVTNTGNVDLTDVTVTDPLLVAPNGSITGGPIATLAVGADDTTTFTGIYVLTQADIDAGEFENSATVTGGAVDENGDPITDENDDPLVVTDTSDDPNNTEDVDENGDGDPDDPTTTDLTNPMMELEKEGTYMDTNGDTVVSVGDEIHYTFTVTNTGNVDLTDVTVTDPLLVAPNGSITGGPIATLAVGADDTTTFTGIYVLTQADIDAGEFENSATVTGGAVDENGDPITDENDDPLVVTDTSDDPTNSEDVDANGDGDPDDPTVTNLSDSQIELEKEGTYMDTDGNGVVNVGDEIHYTFTVINTGNVDLTNVTVTDPLLVAPNGSIAGGPIALLAVGANDTVTFTGVYVLTQADIDAGEFENSATVSAEEPGGDPNDPSDDVTDTSDDPNNTEDVDENGDGDPDDPTTTDLTNPMMELEKEGTYIDTNGDTVVSVGDEIHYTFTITNTGNVDLTDVTVTDPLLVAPNGSITGDPIAILAVGAEDTTTFTGIYVLTQADIDAGEFENSATVTGGAVDENGDPITDENDDPLEVTDTSDDPTNPDNVDENGDGDPDDPTVTNLSDSQIELTKEGEYMDVDGNGIVNVGDVIEYTFTVTNIGNLTVDNITIDDDTIGIADLAISPSSLIPGGVGIAIATYPITQEDIDAGGAYNIATATGTDPNGEVVSDESEDPTPIDPTDPTNPPVDPDCPACTITPLANPMVSLEKAGEYQDANGDNMVNLGDVIEYTFTVTNTGNLPLTGLEISDPLLGTTPISVDPDTLAPGEVGTATAVYQLTQADMDLGTVTNIATVTGQDPNGNDVTDTSDDPSSVDPDDPTVTVLPDSTECLTVYNLLTPNGDGDNETLTITCIEDYPEAVVSIYNRWGNVVYEVEGYDNNNGWNGTSSGGRAVVSIGEKLPAGTYYYVIDLKNDSPVVKGWIQIAY